MGTAIQGVHQAPDCSGAWCSRKESALKDRGQPYQLPGFEDMSLTGSGPGPNSTFSAVSLAFWPWAGREGKWPVLFLLLPLSRCMMLLSLMLNALHTVRAIAVMIAGRSHYHYLWLLNTSCCKSCLKHRGRHLHYCIIDHVFKLDFVLKFQSGQVSLENLVSSLSYWVLFCFVIFLRFILF